ncbi:MAG: ABC transporter permease [Chloroflexi bacterium]|nr:ABC transporter permease [Chloroflexota bacterium]
MRQYVVRRVLLMIPAVVIASLFVFAIIRLFPGDIVMMLSSDRELPPEEYEREIARIGLDKPVAIQYFVWVGSLLRGDFGNSLLTKKPVMKEIGDRLPVTLELGLLALLFSLVFGIPIGVWSAIRQDTWGDYIGRSLAIGAISIPGFWLATVAILVLSLYFRWMPPIKYVPFSADPLGNLQIFVLPSIILGLEMAGILMRMTRTAFLDVLRQDFIRTARAKGLSEYQVNLRHAMANAIIPVLMLLGISIARLIGGTVILESIFNLPGLGRWVLSALTFRDYPAIQATVIFLVVAVLLINIAVDLLHAALDPRLRLN